MKQKIYINGRFLTQNITGVQRYALEMTYSIDKLLGKDFGDTFTCEILLPQHASQIKLNNIKIKKIGYFFSGHLWEQIVLPFFARDGLLINLCNTAPAFKREQIVVIHDASVFDYPECFKKVFTLWYQFLFLKLAQRCKLVITDSNFSNRQLTKHLAIQKSKIFVIPCATSQTFNRAENNEINAVKSIYGLPAQYFIFIGSLDPRKNLKTLLKAWAIVNTLLPKAHLAIIGANGKAFSNLSLDKIPDNVTFLNRLPDGHMIPLLSGACALVYPSLYEGFGLPPLEAMAVGTPVIVANTSSLPEVVSEDAGYFIDPHSPESIAKGILFFAESEDNCEQFRKKGLERARLFSWDKSAASLLSLLKNILLEQNENRNHT